jgi:hypothetical protein
MSRGDAHRVRGADERFFPEGQSESTDAQHGQADGSRSARIAASTPSMRHVACTALLGRDRELKVVTHLLRAAESGRGAALVLRGEAGIGKTALIEHALRNVAGFKILHAAGTEFETVLPFAGLHQLCAPVLDRAAALPAPQQAALEAALGRREGAPRDRLLVGLAALGLFSECGRREPIVCVVDDAQWLDAGTAHALAFAARRIESEPVAMVFLLREPLATNGFTDLPDLWVEGLDDEDARLLLASEIRAPIDRAVRDRIVAEARGNPLALLELPRSAGMLNLAGGYAIPELHGTAGRIEESFLRRMSELPRQTQMLLVVASAEPLGDPVLLWNALDRLGIPSEAADPAESAGLLEVGQRIRFRHPLVRSAAYRATTPSERRLAHRVLAEVTDSDSDPDRRAWHQAQATLGPSERVAAQLERSAGRAQDRGGLAAAAAFTERAAELTPDAARRAARTVTAARLAQSAGAFSSAMRLLTAAETGRLDERQRTEARLQRAQIAFQLSRDDVSAGMLLDAAEALDGQRAREAYLEAFGAAMYVGRSSPERMLQVARAVRARPPTRHPERPLDLLLDGLCANVVLGFEHAVPTLKQAVLALCDAERLDADDVRWLGLACTVAMGLLDDHAHVLLADRLLRMSRTSGALAALPTALNYRSGAHIFAGELTSAAVLVGEAYAIASATGGAELIYAELAVSAWRGDAGRVGQLLAGRADALARGEGRSVLSMDYASAVLHNGLGDYESALSASLEMAQYDELGYGASPPV